MIEALASVYSFRFPKTIAYMLQASEYNVKAYLKWLWSTNNFKTVMHRRTFVPTGRSKMILRFLQLAILLQAILGIGLLISGLGADIPMRIALGGIVFLSAPFFWANLIVVPLFFVRQLIVRPVDARSVKKAKKTFNTHNAVKIGIAGSYGKTTMKEMLLTVLSEVKKVAATPANKNVASEHAKFAKNLTKNEDVIIFEFGEGAPGDIAKFAKTTKPDIGIITGLAPAHLDKYKTLEAAGQDIFSLASYLKPGNLYVNSEPESIKLFIKPGYLLYDSNQAAGWRISNLKTSANGLSFGLNKASKNLKIKSQLLGAHQVGPLAIVAVIADDLGLTKQQVETGIAKIQPFEHRMRPRQLSGALIIDDTYNGNIEGMKAGLDLLKSLKAKHKIYVTPGLVDQGKKSKEIHSELGQAIAAAKPDRVVLMKHSVTGWIEEGLKTADYKGKLDIEADPLHFYNNLDHFVASGDLVLMQNDWPDQYK